MRLCWCGCDGGGRDGSGSQGGGGLVVWIRLGVVVVVIVVVVVMWCALVEAWWWWRGGGCVGRIGELIGRDRPTSGASPLPLLSPRIPTKPHRTSRMSAHTSLTLCCTGTLTDRHGDQRIHSLRREPAAGAAQGTDGKANARGRCIARRTGLGLARWRKTEDADSISAK